MLTLNGLVWRLAVNLLWLVLVSWWLWRWLDIRSQTLSDLKAVLQCSAKVVLPPVSSPYQSHSMPLQSKHGITGSVGKQLRGVFKRNVDCFWDHLNQAVMSFYAYFLYESIKGPDWRVEKSLQKCWAILRSLSACLKHLNWARLRLPMDSIQWLCVISILKRWSTSGRDFVCHWTLFITLIWTVCITQPLVCLYMLR